MSGTAFPFSFFVLQESRKKCEEKKIWKSSDYVIYSNIEIISCLYNRCYSNSIEVFMKKRSRRKKKHEKKHLSAFILIHTALKMSSEKTILSKIIPIKFNISVKKGVEKTQNFIILQRKNWMGAPIPHTISKNYELRWCFFSFSKYCELFKSQHSLKD